ncbi:MAG: InlB B-repeat-containing protein [Treponema sp.]|nr:InlB B-repeat-containing protein [Treponema sp.]
MLRKKLVLALLAMSVLWVSCNNLFKMLADRDTEGFVTIADEGPLTVKYDDNGKTGGEVPVDANLYARGDKVTVLPDDALVRTGNTFAGWNTEKNGKGKDYKAGDTFNIVTSIILYAKWTCTLTYDGNNSDDDDDTPEDDKSPYVNGATVTVSDEGDLELSDSVFAGWNDGNGRTYFAGDKFTITEDTILKAIWLTGSDVTETTSYKLNEDTGNNRDGLAIKCVVEDNTKYTLMLGGKVESGLTPQTAHPNVFGPETGFVDANVDKGYTFITLNGILTGGNTYDIKQTNESLCLHTDQSDFTNNGSLLTKEKTGVTLDTDDNTYAILLWNGANPKMATIVITGNSSTTTFVIDWSGLTITPK